MIETPHPAPEPMDLPVEDWAGWLGRTCDDSLAEVRRLRELLRRPGHAGPVTLALWNDLTLALRNASSAAQLFASVHPQESVRDRAERAEQDASRLRTEIDLDRGIFDALVGISAQGVEDGLDAAARRVLDLTLRDFRRAGVDRDDADRARLQALAERETAVGQEFDKAIRDDTRSVRVPASALVGLPADYVEAHPVGDDGLVEISTDYPDYLPFATFSRDREARAALVHEFLDRAWPGNDARLRELLALRREHALLLGYDGWPSFDAEVKMIGAGSAIPDFVDRIARASEPAARRDVETLLARVRQDHPGATTIDTVDKAFYTELLRREEFAVDSQRVRSYLDFTRVRAGLLEVTGRLFEVDYVEVRDAATWHADVTTYDVMRAGRRLGRIHLDLHPRPGKYGHAAQFELTAGIAGRQLAEGVLVCNFSRTLMEHTHVVTLFHEFGHLLHHVLAGEQTWARFSGVATEWDFVEAPSQMLEEWAWDADVLQTFATNAAGEPIPADLVDRMRAADDFGKGVQARQQMFYAAVSYWFHTERPADLTAKQVELQERYAPYAYIPGTHFYANFGHLGGYSSAYYTYMWSLVIAKDMFSAFDPEHLFDEAVAGRYRDTVLAAGGTKDAADLVADFLGRPYTFDAYAAWLAR